MTITSSTSDLSRLVGDKSQNGYCSAERFNFRGFNKRISYKIWNSTQTRPRPYTWRFVALPLRETSSSSYLRREDSVSFTILVLWWTCHCPEEKPVILCQYAAPGRPWENGLTVGGWLVSSWLFEGCDSCARMILSATPNLQPLQVSAVRTTRSTTRYCPPYASWQSCRRARTSWSQTSSVPCQYHHHRCIENRITHRHKHSREVYQRVYGNYPHRVAVIDVLLLEDQEPLVDCGQLLLIFELQGISKLISVSIARP